MHQLWYETPAAGWNAALPLGNGTLGAMVFGRPEHELLQLNEDSIWGGRALDRHNPDAAASLPDIRQLLRSGKTRAAEQLALQTLSGTPHSQRSYQTAGECYLDFEGQANYQQYSRRLDLEQALQTVSYQIGQALYTREYLISYPDQVLAVRLRAQNGGRLNFRAHLERCTNWMDEVQAQDGCSVRLLWRPAADQIAFCVKLTITACDGDVSTLGEFVKVSNATQAVLLLTICSSFREPDYPAVVDDRLRRAVNKGYELIKAEQCRDYQHLYQRMELRLGVEDQALEQLPTDERLRRVRAGQSDPGLSQLYFDYARYLLIGSSRAGSLPATLQGIWNADLNPMWNSKYTININLEMNYWMTDPANLADCYSPYFELLDRVKENGKKTAREMYGCRGSVAHHNVDISADTAPQDHYIPASYWVLGEVWLATHIWEHYDYTQDIDFLRRYIDVYEQAARFIYDFAIKNDAGQLVLSPSVSPENTYIKADGTTACMCEGATLDTEILTEFFRGYIKASQVLGLDPSVIEQATAFLNSLPPYKIGRYGQLQEWQEDYEEAEPGHRHISHLYALYPGTQFTRTRTPALLEAARVTLQRRLQAGGGHTGWSRAWIIAFWSRLGDGDLAYDNLLKLLEICTYPNLMDNHPLPESLNHGPDVFQIDGNLGAAAALMDMLFQSHEGFYHCLPAWPQALGNGSVRGLKVRGGAEIGMRWENSQVTWLSIKPLQDEQREVLVNGRKQHLDLKAGQEKILSF
ncbi:glycoside hydrolase family 95 protein [Oscillospiraceae bacterium HV4-5-C5C]|nr:glycoside hydrolase family 95 protein [Oscillospiraceae bacterium HV4-5-C5C]